MNKANAPQPPDLLDKPFPDKPAITAENSPLLGHTLGDVSPPISVAALWLSQHRDEIQGPAIPFVMKRFGLGIREAIDALKRGHALRFGGIEK